jgi:hypothetical protein
MIEKKNYKVTNKDSYLSWKLIEQIVKETDVKKEFIEEEYSELWFETLNGIGKVIFANKTEYEGNVRFGILESGEEGKKSKIKFENGTTYEGEIHNNQLTGYGMYTFPKSK